MKKTLLAMFPVWLLFFGANAWAVDPIRVPVTPPKIGGTLQPGPLQKALPAVEAAPTTWPNVTGYTPTDKGFIGTRIVFTGRDLAYNFFVAKIGAIQLPIISRSATLIEALLPSTPVSGDLTAGYGNPSSTMVLKAGYRVFGLPVITSVQPTTFSKGETVTVTGMDLFAANTVSNYVRIGNSPDGWMKSDYLSVTNRTVSPDGTRMSFMAWDAFAQAADPSTTQGYKFAPVNPPPQSLTGQLRLQYGSDWSVVGPPVTWKPAGFLLSTFTAPPWYGQNVDFVVVQPTVAPSGTQAAGWQTVTYTGLGLDGSAIWMNGRKIADGPSSYSAGNSGWFHVPPNATTDYVKFIKGGQTIQSPFPLKVVGAPRMQDAATTPLLLPLNSEFTINGWDLLTASIPGLTYEFQVSEGSLFQTCKMALQVISHTPNQIRFRINTTGTIPDACLSMPSMFYRAGTNAAYYQHMRLNLVYGGQKRQYWDRTYLILPPN